MYDYQTEIQLLRDCIDLTPAPTLLGVPTDISALQVTRKTKYLERLTEFKNLRSLCAYDIDESTFENICNATQITHLNANIFRIRDIQSLGKLVNLQAVQITDNTKVTSLECLRFLENLRFFAMANCAIKADLSPIANCKELRYIWVSSRYAKPARFKSLAPFSALSKLETIKFKNVRIEDSRLTALHGLTNLVEADLPDFFPKQEFLKLAAALPHLRGYWLELHLAQAGKPSN